MKNEGEWGGGGRKDKKSGRSSCGWFIMRVRVFGNFVRLEAVDHDDGMRRMGRDVYGSRILGMPRLVASSIPSIASSR